MASIISVDTLQDSAGSNEITTANVKTAFDDRVKAFIHYTDNTFAVLKSLNVSSQTDNASGDISYTLTNAMNDADYAAIGEGGGNFSSYYSRIPSHVGSTSTVVRMRHTNSSVYTTADIIRGSSAIFGDLA